ncbi:DUF262 domain-containing protein [Arthrobacter sp. NEB 688]|uniref:DUF262 domain-containing protein n=1 Tax=Arthrobacter sp. NEB 688 TaxID=904039 RepID=UPI001565340C|nr:DUF262 domain-containing protein [Arthrobacter sp. NEB 688]QKE83185.1 DUF262 domain-containing protein [Arthrobacter sp. NEB 688]
MDELSDTRQNISEGIARLSRPGLTPTEFEPTTEIEPEAVSFATGTWRQCLVQIQGWLRLENNLDETSPEAFLRSLATGLGEPETADESLVLPKLAGRLDLASQFRKQFEEVLESEAEGGATRASATQSWLAGWGEVDEEQENEGSGPIKAEASTWPVSEFVGYATDGELSLSPSYQRADVWPTTTAQQLIESILRGIPLPSVILLQRTLNQRVMYETVDGKQRLTSILRFVGRHPRALDLVREKEALWGHPGLVQIFQTDYPQFKKLWRANESQTLTEGVARDYYFPFPLRTGDVKPLSGLENLKGRYFCEIRDQTIDVVGEPRPVSSLFEKPNSKYRVPVIVYETVTSDQIHEVFSLYNKQGKHLNAEEIRNALYHNLDFMRALLVTAGDSEEVDAVAPFLSEVWEELASTPEVLDSYGFAKAGYKRTKLLSWVAAALLFNDGKAPSRSTAAQVNALLKRIDDNTADPLRNSDRVRDTMRLLDRALDAHAVIPDDIWSPKFKNAQEKSKWQELQLVATLIAFSAAAVVLDEKFEQRLEESLEAISERSADWRRPAKTQTREQWKFIAGVVTELLDILGVAPDEADGSVASRFGSSGLQALTGLAPTADEHQ